MQNIVWIGLVFLFLQLLLASCSEGENLLAVVEHGARVVSTVEDGVDVPGGAKTVGNPGLIWWGGVVASQTLSSIAQRRRVKGSGAVPGDDV